MIAVICLVIAAICFFLAAVNQTVLQQPPADLQSWGLFFVALAMLLPGAITIYRERAPR